MYKSAIRKTYFFSQKVAKFDEKNEENGVVGKNLQKSGSWDALLLNKNQIWMDFGVPGEAIGKAMGGILVQKKGNEKNI